MLCEICYNCAMTINIGRDDITLAIALLGALLGVINTFRDISRDRPRLKVAIKAYIMTHAQGFCIEVVNTGQVAAQVTQVGIALSRRDIFIIPYWQMSQQLPKMLAPGASVSFYAPPGTEYHPDLARARRAFARIGTGRSFHASRRSTARRFVHAAAARQHT